MPFIKHIGKHGDRKVAIVFREVPGEEHMTLVVYPDVMPVSFHDTLMSVIESPQGQAAQELSEVLHRSLLPDGRGILEGIHKEGMLKKVPSNQIIVTPTPTASVRLDELNNILREMSQGEDAQRKLAELDSQAGLQVPAAKKYAGLPPEASLARNAAQAGGLDDAALGQSFAEQAARMAAEARSLLAESQRLMDQAAALRGDTGAAAKPAAAKRGRPAKV